MSPRCVLSKTTFGSATKDADCEGEVVRVGVWVSVAGLRVCDAVEVCVAEDERETLGV